VRKARGAHLLLASIRGTHQTANFALKSSFLEARQIIKAINNDFNKPVFIPLTNDGYSTNV
jgi:hypothetical protein